MDRLGRGGEGPGEFASLGQAWARGDTIEAFDSRLRRITRFLPDGSVEVVTLEREVPAETAIPAPLPDGWVVAGIAGASPGARDEIVVHRFGRDGAHLGEIARVPGIERAQYPTGGAGPPPLSPRAVIDAHGYRVYLAETLVPEIRVLDATGSPRDPLSWDPGPGPMPAEALRLVRDSALVRADPDRCALLESQLQLAPPEEISVFWSFLSDPEGYLWIRPYEPLRHAVALGGLGAGSYLLGGAGHGGDRRILALDGSEVSSVRVPDELRLLRVERDAVVGLHRNELGVESVRVHRLERR